MSDEQQEQEAPEVKQDTEVEAKPEPKMFSEAYVKELRAEAASYRTKLKSIEDADKSETQRLTDRLAELERENASYKQRDQVQAWSREIAKDAPHLAPALRGSTREELEEHFALLQSLDKKPTPKAAPSGKAPDERDKPTSAAEALRALRKG